MTSLGHIRTSRESCDRPRTMIIPVITDEEYKRLFAAGNDWDFLPPCLFNLRCCCEYNTRTELWKRFLYHQDATKRIMSFPGESFRLQLGTVEIYDGSGRKETECFFQEYCARMERERPRLEELDIQRSHEKEAVRLMNLWYRRFVREEDEAGEWGFMKSLPECERDRIFGVMGGLSEFKSSLDAMTSNLQYYKEIHKKRLQEITMEMAEIVKTAEKEFIGREFK